MKNSSLGEPADNKYLYIANKYPLHLAVWENNLQNLKKFVKKYKNDLENVDPHGRSPLQLAVILNHFDCVRILLENGADVLDSLNKDGWSIIHEATSVGNEEMLKLLLQYRYYQRYVKEMKSIPKILEAIHAAPDFYFEMKWEFSSLIPLLSKFCPSDTCKVWKSGPNVRIDTTLIDFQEQGANRGPRSYLFHGTGAEAKFIEVDHDKKRISTEIYEVGVPMETIELELMKPYPAHVRQRLANPIMTTYLDVDNISFERNKSGIWGWRSDRTENIQGYECNVFNASNVELVTKTRIEHLSTGARKDLCSSAGGKSNQNSAAPNGLPSSPYTNGLESSKLLLPSIPLVSTLFGFKTVSDSTHDDPRMHVQLNEENLSDPESQALHERRLSAPEKLKCNSNSSSFKDKLLSRSSNCNLLEGLASASQPKNGASSPKLSSGVNALTSTLSQKLKSKKLIQPETKTINKTGIDPSRADSTGQIPEGKSSDSDRSSESEGAFESAASSDTSLTTPSSTATKTCKDGSQNGKNNSASTYNPARITLERYFFPPNSALVKSEGPVSNGGGSDGALTQAPTSKNSDIQIGRIKKEVISKSQKFKATLWLSEQCPLSLQDQILPIIDLMPKSNAHFSKLKEFITLQLPPGFPVKIEIPIFHIFNARVTFANICAKDEEAVGVCKLLDDKTGKLSCIIDSSVFEIPKGYSGCCNDEQPIYGSPSALSSAFMENQYGKYTTEEESLLQYAIQQSLIDLGTENDKVTVWEALKKEQPSLSTDLQDSTTPAVSMSMIEDDDLAKAIKLSEKEILDRQKLESVQMAELEEILKLSLIEK